jgi:hypothetical protein
VAIGLLTRSSRQRLIIFYRDFTLLRTSIVGTLMLRILVYLEAFWTEVAGFILT